MNFTNNQKGFSLIELTIVITILGVLVSIGVPRYKVSVEKTKAKEATSFLHSVETQQARFMAEMGRYARSLKELEGRMGETMKRPSFFYITPMWARDWEKDWQIALYRNGPTSGFGRYYITWDEDGFVPKHSSIPSELAPQSSRTTTSCSGPIPSSRGIADPTWVQN